MGLVPSADQASLQLIAASHARSVRLEFFAETVLRENNMHATGWMHADCTECAQPPDPAEWQSAYDFHDPKHEHLRNDEVEGDQGRP